MQKKVQICCVLEIELSRCLTWHTIAHTHRDTQTHSQNCNVYPPTNGWHRTQTPDYEPYKRFMILMHTNRRTHKSLARSRGTVTVCRIAQVSHKYSNSNNNIISNTEWTSKNVRVNLTLLQNAKLEIQTSHHYVKYFALVFPSHRSLFGCGFDNKSCDVLNEHVFLMPISVLCCQFRVCPEIAWIFCLFGENMK